MSEASKRVFPIWFTLVVTMVFIAITSVVYTMTKEKIQLNERVRLMKSVLVAAGVEMPAEPAEIEKVFTRRVKEVKDDSGGVGYYIINEEDGSTVSSYVLVRKGAGLWGTITATVGLSRDLGVFVGMEVIDQSETPGLGGRISEQWFKEQFRGKEGPMVTVPEGSPADEKNQFQAITGATYSTNAIKNLMNGASEHGRQIIEKQ
jgi:Na+-transporting NADH:ubiquinone oxidoreductase subunit C